MSKKLFIGGLAWAVTDEELREAFLPMGNVTDAKVIVDRQTGRSKGFGFVSFENEEDAARAHEQMQGADIHGRPVRIDTADDKPAKSRPRRPFNRDREGGDNRDNRRHEPAPMSGGYDTGDDDSRRSGRDNRRRDRKSERDQREDKEQW